MGIQEAYGFMVDHETNDIIDDQGNVVTDQTYIDASDNVIYSDQGIRPEMLQWWYNFRNSRNTATLASQIAEIWARERGVRITLKDFTPQPWNAYGAFGFDVDLM